MNFIIEIEQEDDGRIIAEIPTLPGVLVYGQSREEAIARAKALALRVLAEKLHERNK
ncbi:MAG TPA: type II toxin-antitoxin system HicB family antitoxin [Herpetosiphonaceae bacterium]